MKGVSPSGPPATRGCSLCVVFGINLAMNVFTLQCALLLVKPVWYYWRAARLVLEQD
jgi:hypothetical protein